MTSPARTTPEQSEAWIRVGAEWLLFATWALVSLLSASVTSPMALVAAACIVTAVALRRRCLSWAVLLAAVAVAVQLVDRSNLAVFADLGYAPVLYTLGSSPTVRIRRAGLGAALLSLVLGPLAFVGIHTTSHGRTLLLQAATTACLTAFITLGAWIMGHNRWLSRQRTHDLLMAQRAEAEQHRLEHLLEQAERRERMAHDMHDVVGHSWAVVAAQSDGARYAVETNPHAALTALETIGETARAAIHDLRAFLERLRNLEADENNDTSNLDGLFTRMRNAGMLLDVQEAGLRPAQGPMYATTRHVMAEALANALKYADRTQPVDVRLDWEADGAVLLHVRNTTASTSRLGGTGTGLHAMTTRVHQVGGHLNTHREDAIWVLEMHLPPRQHLV